MTEESQSTLTTHDSYAGSGLKVAGSGTKLAGEGWKKGLGGTLISLGLLGGLGNLGEKNIEGIIGASILGGLGGYLIHLDNKQSGKGMKNVFDKRFQEMMKKALIHHQVGGAIKPKMIKEIVQKNIMKPIGVKDIFGDEWKHKGKELIQSIIENERKKREQEGGNLLQDIGKTVKRGYKSVKTVRDKSLDKLKQFAAGKTKFKPSQLASYLSGAVGIAGAASAFIPGVDLISVPTASAAALGLKGVSEVLKTSGRGRKKGKGIGEATTGLLADPSMVPEAAHRLVRVLAESDSSITKSYLGLLLGITGATLTAAYALYKSLKKENKKTKKGSGLSLAGGKRVQKRITKQKEMLGSGKVPFGIKYNTNGTIKRDRYSVYHGIYAKTAGGLTKDDFIKRGNKIISKKKSERGKKLIENMKNAKNKK